MRLGGIELLVLAKAIACRPSPNEMDKYVEEIILSAEDIPRAKLTEPFDKHPHASLHWWLLCRRIKVSQSLKKKELISR